MKHQKTKLKENFSRENFQNLALVGLPRENYRSLKDVSKMAGYNPSWFDRISEFYDGFKKNEKDYKLIIVSPGYKYLDSNFNENIPIEEIPFCSIEGLNYFEKRKRQRKPYFQGLQLIKKLKEEKLFSPKNIAVYGRSWSYEEGYKTQTKMLGADFIDNFLDKGESIPFNFHEYLRNKNQVWFEK